MASEIPSRLEALAAQAQARSAGLSAELKRRRGLPAGPGDLFVLRATADLPVEWAILERGAGGGLLAVPADAGPPAGTADVEVRAGAPGGPLSLRCRFGVWLDGSLFEPDLRSGTLAPEIVDEALQRIRQVESGTLEGSPLAEEVDADPEYMDWIGDVPKRARELALVARVPVPRPSRISSWGMAHRLAAALALVSIGLALWVGVLLRQVNRFSNPILAPLSEEVVLGEDVRGIIVVPLSREEDRVALALAFAIEPQDGYLEIVDRTGKMVWRSARVRLAKVYSLTLSRKLLPYGDYQVRVFPASGFDSSPLATETLRVEPAE